DFANWPVLGDKTNTKTTKYFVSFSAGLKSGRDTWIYAQSKPQLLENLNRFVNTYDEARLAFELWTSRNEITAPKEPDFNAFLREFPEFADTTKIAWNRTLKNLACKQKPISVSESRSFNALYRPFTNQLAYFQADLNDMTYRLPSMLPTQNHENIGFVSTSPGESVSLSVLATSLLPDLHLLATSQYFPRFIWEP